MHFAYQKIVKTTLLHCLVLMNKIYYIKVNNLLDVCIISFVLYLCITTYLFSGYIVVCPLFSKFHIIVAAYDVSCGVFRG